MTIVQYVQGKVSISSLFQVLLYFHAVPWDIFSAIFFHSCLCCDDDLVSSVRVAVALWFKLDCGLYRECLSDTQMLADV